MGMYPYVPRREAPWWVLYTFIHRREAPWWVLYTRGITRVYGLPRASLNVINPGYGLPRALFVGRAPRSALGLSSRFTVGQ